MVLDHQGQHASHWAAIGSIAAKIGCSGAALQNRIRQSERDRVCGAVRARTSASGSRRWSARTARLRQAIEILRKASAYFAMAELDRPFKR